MIRFLYTVLFYILTPFILIRLYWKGRKLPAYRARWKERFLGSQDNQIMSVDIWLHAVSLGEVIAAIPLIESFLNKNFRVCVTTMTPTGSEQVLRRFGVRVLHQYIPYDFPHALRRFFKVMQPRVGVIMETELWPNLIVEAKRAKVTLFLANARISDKAYAQYRMIDWLLKPILKNFTCIMTQSCVDASRYQMLSDSSTQIKILGNLKFDVKLPARPLDTVLSMKKMWGEERPVLILASTHEDEEQQILRHLKTLQCDMPGVVVLIAPRHPERFEYVFELCLKLKYRTGRRSVLETIDKDSEVIVIDSLGELISFYGVSDYAFVGGSFVPIGGHNVLEPIACDVPVLCGPFMQNSQTTVKELLVAKALTQVEDSSAFVSEIIKLHREKALVTLQVENAKKILHANQGAVIRHLEVIEQSL
jgi:3-deoxy-D-manno-octulosonic-acid transferase